LLVVDHTTKQTKHACSWNTCNRASFV